MSWLLPGIALGLQMFWIASLQGRSRGGSAAASLATLILLSLSGIVLVASSRYADLDVLEGVWVGMSLIVVMVERGLSGAYRLTTVVIAMVEILSTGVVQWDGSL